MLPVLTKEMMLGHDVLCRADMSLLSNSVAYWKNLEFEPFKDIFKLLVNQLILLQPYMSLMN